MSDFDRICIGPLSLLSKKNTSDLLMLHVSLAFNRVIIIKTNKLIEFIN